MNILAISAHPDDIDYGCSGTLARLVEEGNQVTELIVTDGSKGHKPHMEDTSDLVSLRQKEQRNAAASLGITEVRFLGVPDGEVENTRALRKKLVREIRSLTPELVFSFDPANRSFRNRFVAHRDHRELSEAVFDAVSPAAKNPAYFPDLLEEELMPHTIQEFWFFASRSPNRHVDISPFMDQKLDALASHASQVPDREWIEDRILPRARGTARDCSFEFAEAFRVLGV